MLPAETSKPETPEAEALLRAAARDLKTIEILMRDAESPLASVCFHAQQYLEKVMKAALVANGVIFRRTHDLSELADLVERQGMTLPATRDQLARLNPFAVVFRYDDVEITMIDISDVAEIIQTAQTWEREGGSMAQPQQGTPYTNETQIAVTCTVCGHRWQMTYGELQHTRVIYKGDAPASRPCAGEEYHVTCRNPRHAEVIVFCLPAKE